MRKVFAITMALVFLMGSGARASGPDPVVETSFYAETRDSPIATMSGYWHTDGWTAKLAFSGGNAIGSDTRMSASWRAKSREKMDSVRLRLRCDRFSGGLEDRRNRWEIRIAMIPRSRSAGVRRDYRFPISGNDLFSGEDLSFSLEGFKKERWTFRVLLKAWITTAAEFSGMCDVEAGSS